MSSSLSKVHICHGLDPSLTSTSLQILLMTAKCLAPVCSSSCTLLWEALKPSGGLFEVYNVLTEGPRGHHKLACGNSDKRVLGRGHKHHMGRV